MYSPRIVERNVDFFSASEGWEPVRHTFNEILEFTAYIKSITKLASNSKGAWIDSVAPMTDKRRQEIRKWIQNEQILCGLDCSGFRGAASGYSNDLLESKTSGNNHASSSLLHSQDAVRSEYIISHGVCAEIKI